MRVKEAVEEHFICGALVVNYPGSAVPEGVNENLEEEFGPEVTAFSSKKKSPPAHLFTPKTNRSKGDNAYSSVFLLLWNRVKESQDPQLSSIKELVQSFATTMGTRQKTNEPGSSSILKHKCFRSSMLEMKWRF